MPFCGNCDPDQDEQGQSCEDSDCKNFTVSFYNLTTHKDYFYTGIQNLTTRVSMKLKIYLRWVIYLNF